MLTRSGVALLLATCLGAAHGRSHAPRRLLQNTSKAWCWEDGKNLYGYDVWMDGGEKPSNAKQCAILCEKTPNCNAVSWQKVTSVKACNLKSVSGTVQLDDSDDSWTFGYPCDLATVSSPSEPVADQSTSTPTPAPGDFSNKEGSGDFSSKEGNPSDSGGTPDTSTASDSYPPPPPSSESSPTPSGASGDFGNKEGVIDSSSSASKKTISNCSHLGDLPGALGQNWNGYNLPEAPVITPNEAACRAACLANSECGAYTYHEFGVPEPKQCWIKATPFNVEPEASVDPNARAGRVRCLPSTDSADDDVIDTGIGGGSSDDQACSLLGKRPGALGKNWPGDNLTNMPIETVDEDACRDACYAYPACGAYTYYELNDQSTKIQQCWLKATPADKEPEDYTDNPNSRAGRVRCLDASGASEDPSAPTECDNLNVYSVKGFDWDPKYGLENMPLLERSENGCQDACDANPACTAYTYHKKGDSFKQGECWLKNAPGDVSWVKSDDPESLVGRVRCQPKVPGNDDVIDSSGPGSTGDDCLYLGRKPGLFSQDWPAEYALRDMPVQADTEDICIDLCERKPGCTTYTYHPVGDVISSGECWQFSTPGDVAYIRNSDPRGRAGRVRCAPENEADS